MSVQTTDPGAAVALGAAKPAAPPTAGAQHIIHPWVDFLCLGGASLIIIPFVMMLPASAAPALIATAWIVADVLNHPHFAASYQIFYRNYRAKLAGEGYTTGMRVRYVIAGIVVPAVLIGFFAISFALKDALLLGWLGNVMLFLVGWHYVKQGYGMLIVDSVYKRKFLGDTEKTILRYNAYACWIMYWVGSNWLVAEYRLWGLEYYAFPVPYAVLVAVGAVAAVSTAITLWVLGQRLRPGAAGLPLTGVVAYLATLYIWLAARWQPMTLMVVPALHSLQYLLIVYRYEQNRARDEAADAGEAAGGQRWHVLRFGIVAVVLGLLGFWWAPKLLDGVVSYDREVFGGTAFLFMFWIFINIHHYFMDNVIWRRENPDTARSLFGMKKKPQPV